MLIEMCTAAANTIKDHTVNFPLVHLLTVNSLEKLIDEAKFPLHGRECATVCDETQV